MSLSFEELAFQPTPIGELSLRRRRDPVLKADVIEIKLGEEFLMSDRFTASEIALADLGLALLNGDKLDVVVGGLGLGYTAQAVLKDKRVSSLIVVDALQAIIDWHQDGLLPLGPELTADARNRFELGDFFAMAASEEGFDPAAPARKFDAVLVDIDHSPEFLLDPQNASFYEPQGLQKLSMHLKPGGVFGLWSNDLPDESFTARLASIFDSASAETVSFFNPLQNKDFVQTVYLARTST